MTNIKATFIIGISETPTFVPKKNIPLIINNIRLIVEYTYTLTVLNVSNKYS